MSRKISLGGLEGNMFSWQPGQDTPQNLAPPQSQTKQNGSPIIVPEFSVEDLLERGREFESTKKGSNGEYIGAPTALNEVMEYIGTEGLIATMPFIVAGYSKANSDHFLRNKWHTAHTEDNIIPDRDGTLTSGGKSVYMCVHGGGLLTPERIFKAYGEGLTNQNAAKYTDDEARDLLNGVLPNGDRIDIYHVDDVANGRIANPFGRYAVWMEFDEAKQFESGYYKKDKFKQNKIVHARTGTLEYLDDYFEKAKHSDDNDLNCSHKFDEIDSSQAQGRLLFVDDDCNGLLGLDDLDDVGRFVGVVPKAHGAPTR